MRSTTETKKTKKGKRVGKAIKREVEIVKEIRAEHAAEMKRQQEAAAAEAESDSESEEEEEEVKPKAHAVMFNCKVCKKKYKSNAQLESHYSSKAHVKKQRAFDRKNGVKFERKGGQAMTAEESSQ